MSPEAEPHSHHDPAHGDSAGFPWEGRSFTPNPFAGDDGSADPVLAAALARFRDAHGSAVDLIEAYRHARLLIPLVADRGEEGIGHGGMVVDKTQELSIVTVAAPDGRRVLPVFSSVQALARWDSTARPVPAEGVRTAVAAVEDGTDLIVVDPGSETEFVIRRPAVWAIARGEEWVPPHLSADVFAGFHESIGSELAVLDLDLEAADPEARGGGPELAVRLHLVPGLERAELDVVLQRLAKRWASDDRIAVLVDSLTVSLLRGA